MAELQGLIRVAKASIDDQRRVLAELLRQADDLSNQRLVLAQDLAREQETARDGRYGESLHLGPYVAAAVARGHQLDEAVAAVRVNIEAAREALREAYRELRALELADESRARRRAEARARREREELDEIGLQCHQRSWLRPQSPPACEESA